MVGSCKSLQLLHKKQSSFDGVAAIAFWFIAVMKPSCKITQNAEVSSKAQACFQHYVSMAIAITMVSAKDQVRLKKYLYVLRPILPVTG